MISGARNYVSVPAVEVALGGVLRVARVIEVSDPHDLLGAEYETDACAEANVWDEFCTDNPVGTKLFDEGPDLVEGDPFAVYAGVSCQLAHLDVSKARAERRLAYGESRLVDAHICDWLATNSVDVGTTTAAKIEDAIGMLENYAATVYGGAPTLLVPRRLVPLACRQGLIVTGFDGALTTCQGSRIANVACGDADGPWTVYATGQITLLRGAVVSFATSQQPVSTTVTNPARALAERLYVPLIECLAARVEVTP